MSNIIFYIKEEQTYVDPTSITLSDENENYGIRRLDTLETVVADNTNLTKIDTGIYSYTFSDPAPNLSYGYSIEIDETFYLGTVQNGSSKVTISLTNYVTEAEATTYLETNKLNRKIWTNSSLVDREIALTNATKIINRLPLLGSKTNSNQINAFPRGGDTEVPQDIKDACVELAFSLLDKNQEFEFENLTVLSKSLGNVSVTSRQKVSKPYVAMGILSYEAYILLLPYLRVFDTIELERIS